MADAEEIYPDRICWICNAIEPADKLVTCCRCKRSTEHTCCMRNKHFGTRVFWLCGECPSNRCTTNRCAEEERPGQELAEGSSKFKKLKRYVKRSDTLTCTRSSRVIRVENNIQPVVQKSLCAADLIKKLDSCRKEKDAMVDTSQKKLRKPSTSYISADTCKTRQTKLLAAEEVDLINSNKRSRLHGCVNNLSCRPDKQKFLHPSISKRKSTSIYPSTSISVVEDCSKRIKRPNDVVHPGSSLKRIPTGNDSGEVQKMKDSGLDGETYLWGVVHHEKSRSPELVQFSPSHRTDAVTESNNCARSDTSDIYAPGVADLHCVPIPVSKDPNYVNPSSLKIPSENVPIPVADLDDPLGVSSLIPPRVSRCSRSQHPSSSHKTTCEGSLPSRMESRGHIVETTLEPHQVQPSNLDTSSGFLEPNSGASNNVKSSVVNLPLEKVTNLIDPDVPPGFSSPRIPVPFGLLSSQHSNRSRKINLKDPRLRRMMDSSSQIAATTVGGYRPASTPHQVQPKCHVQKADANLHTSNPIDPDAAYGFSKFGPPGFSEPASYERPSSSSPAIRMDPMSPIKKYDGYGHSATLGGYPHQPEVQPRFHQVGYPVYQDIRPGFSQFGPPSFPQLPSWSTRPSSLLVETPSEAAAGSSRLLDRRGHLTPTNVGGYAAPASQIHEMQTNYRQMPAGPHRPVFRPSYSQARPSSSSSLEIPFKAAAWSSRTRTVVGGYATAAAAAAAASQQNKMQPNYYPQGPPPPPTARSNQQ